MFLEAEWRVGLEARDLLKRRPDHLKRVISLYAISLMGYDRGLLLRKAYMPVRYVDDLLDGDTEFVGDPLEFESNLRNQITTNNFDEQSNISMLLRSALVDLEAKKGKNDDFRGDFIRTMSAIEFDYHRALRRGMLSSSELTEYYHDAFDPVMNITCGAIDSSVRATDIPIMSIGQGLVQSYRDRKIDWKRGVINIPREVLDEACLNNELGFEEVDNNRVIYGWWTGQLSEVKKGFNKLLPELKGLPELRTYLLCKALVSPLIKRIDRAIK